MKWLMKLLGIDPDWGEVPKAGILDEECMKAFRMKGDTDRDC
jgi:hypothetical protein